MAYHLVGLSSHRDDEDVVNAMKMSISHVKIPDGQAHQ